VLVFDVLDVNEVVAGQVPPQVGPDEPPGHPGLVPKPWRSVSRKNFQESYHDALQLKEEATGLFNLGLLDLRGAGPVEQLFWGCCEAILKIIRELDYVPDDLEGLEKGLADTYYGNFSVFQSVPDHWAVKQLFPTMPLHRHNERPIRRGVIADLTCDSDGKVDQFIDLRDVKDYLELHPFDGRPYYLGMFLVGAYQEILGDLHNLFGDTNAVHVSLDQNGYRIDHVVEGDTVSEVLGYVQYDKRHLVQCMRQANEDALRRGLLTLEESALLMRRFEEGMMGYTYLEEGPRAALRDDANRQRRQWPHHAAARQQPTAGGDARSRAAARARGRSGAAGRAADTAAPRPRLTVVREASQSNGAVARATAPIRLRLQPRSASRLRQARARRDYLTRVWTISNTLISLPATVLYISRVCESGLVMRTTSRNFLSFSPVIHIVHHAGQGDDVAGGVGAAGGRHDAGAHVVDPRTEITLPEQVVADGSHAFEGHAHEVALVVLQEIAAAERPCGIRRCPWSRPEAATDPSTSSSRGPVAGHLLEFFVLRGGCHVLRHLLHRGRHVGLGTLVLGEGGSGGDEEGENGGVRLARHEHDTNSSRT
jgi:hypothetical protein